MVQHQPGILPWVLHQRKAPNQGFSIVSPHLSVVWLSGWVLFCCLFCSVLVFSSLFLFQEILSHISRCDPACSGCTEVSAEEGDEGVNLDQCWPKNSSQRWIMPGPNSASGFLSCFISFPSLAQEKLPDPIFILILKLDLRERRKFMKSLNSADCRLPKGFSVIFWEILVTDSIPTTLLGDFWSCYIKNHSSYNKDKENLPVFKPLVFQQLFRFFSRQYKKVFLGQEWSKSLINTLPLVTWVNQWEYENDNQCIVILFFLWSNSKAVQEELSYSVEIHGFWCKLGFNNRRRWIQSSCPYKPGRVSKTTFRYLSYHRLPAGLALN